MTLIVCLFAVFIACGAWVSRMSGGAPPKLPWGLDQWIYAIPYGLINGSAGLWALLGYAGAFIAKRTGHGRGMSLREPMEAGTSPEKLEYLVLWSIKLLPTYWYKALILAVIGLAGTLPVGIIHAIFIDRVAGIFLAVSGVSKALAYMLGWMFYPDGHDGNPKDSEIDEATEIGELFAGVFGYSALGAVFIYELEAGLLNWF